MLTAWCLQNTVLHALYCTIFFFSLHSLPWRKKPRLCSDMTAILQGLVIFTRLDISLPHYRVKFFTRIEL